MKYSEELQLRLKGVKSDEIKALKEKEAEEIAAAEAEKKEKEQSDLEAALDMVKDLEDKLQKKTDELEKKTDELDELNKQYVALTNKQTVKDIPEHTEHAADVFNQLFNSKKEA